MKLLVLEFMSGGGMLNQAIPESLFCEGDRMLRSLMDDLTVLDNIELIVLRDGRYRLPDIYYEIVNIIEINHGFQQTWFESINHADAVWPIAPETEAILEQLCLDVEQANKHLLNSDSVTVALTAGKVETIQRLNHYYIDTIPTCKLTDFTHQWPAPWVIKPNKGVGCEDCRLMTKHRSLETLINHADAHRFIIQPYINGEALSLSAVFHNGNSQLLSINRQIIKIERDHFHLSRCEVNAFPDTDGRFQQLLSNIATALPGLWGYAGVDLILTPNQHILVLEINPRLTTSYCNLHKTLGINPAEMIIKQVNELGI